MLDDLDSIPGESRLFITANMCRLILRPTHPPPSTEYPSPFPQGKETGAHKRQFTSSGAEVNGQNVSFQAATNMHAFITDKINTFLSSHGRMKG
jgi:hypothetical protein